MTVEAPEEGGMQARWRGGIGKVDGVVGYRWGEQAKGTA